MPNMYLGYYVPNVWHNTTIICSMPFAIICYYLSTKQFEKFSSKRNFVIASSVCLGVLMKPSFFFPYCVIYPLFLFYRYRLNSIFYKGMMPIFVGILCMGYEYFSIYSQNASSDSMKITLFYIFSYNVYKTNILCFLSSVLLPLIVLILKYKDVLQDKEFLFSILMFFVSLGIFWCCRETGSRAEHLNFYWQIVPTMWYLYFVLVRKYIIKSTSKILKSTYFTLFLFGLFYLCNYLITGYYY